MSVDAQFGEDLIVEPLVEQFRQCRGRTVVCVFGRVGPPYRTLKAKLAPLGGRGVIPAKEKAVSGAVL